MLEKAAVSCKRFFRKNGGLILSVIASAGVVATGVFTAKSAIKATKELSKIPEENDDISEKAKIVIPAYAPAVMMGVATIGCIMGAGYFSRRSQISMTGAYAVLKESYDKYREKVVNEFGPEIDTNIRKEIVADKLQTVDREHAPERELFYEEHYGDYFESTMEDVLKAEYQLNRNLSVYGVATLSDFYHALGMSVGREADGIGWEVDDDMMEFQGYAWVEFNHDTVLADDGLECTIISYMNPPRLLDQ